MGAKESKQSCISYEDAIKRVSDIEIRRIRDAFKKSAGVGKVYLSQKAFCKDVLCESVPPNIAQLLFSACGGSARGISFRDLLCGLVLFSKGTEEEKIRFLWNLYCNDAGTYINKSEFTRASCIGSHDAVVLFDQFDRANFEQFRDWIKDNTKSMVLSKWLLLDACIHLTSDLDTPTFYQSLAGVTHLEEKDIGDLEKEFWQLKNTSSSGQLDLELLGPLISPPIPKNALKGLFHAFDENRDGHIDFKELCCGVSAACRGPIVERTRFCFKIFDIDRDGILCHKETTHLCNVLLFVAKENRNSVEYNDLNRDEIINDLLRFTKGKCNQTANRSELKFTAENICLTPEDFMLWSVESNLKLVQPFLDLVFEVCHIVFGLWPQCRHLEYDIVRGWLIREEKRQYRVGQFWYLISHDWWITWLQYTQSNVASCEYCKTTYSQRLCNVGEVDEAIVCDESFNSDSLENLGDTSQATDSHSLGPTCSVFSNGRGSNLKPGPIDNSNLITNLPYKNVRILTGEGGHLKRNTPLVQNHDFELVPKSLWKALNRWYGDNLSLPRQVIQPPNSADVELELYPLNLRILLHQSPNNLAINNWNSVSAGYGAISSGGYAAISTGSMLQLPKRYLAYTAAFSRLATVLQIATFLCEQLCLKFEDIRLWHIPVGLENTAILLEEEHRTLTELLIKDNDQILLEIRNKDLTWPEELGSLVSSQSTSADRRLTCSSVQTVRAPGATGLHNLGNTCFMNAALQVLFNTQPLAKYFHRNMHLFELNMHNKLGTKGQLAIYYGELLKEIWIANARSVAPLKLRFCVTKHAPQFSGGGQHDSQELLEWILDALHEDLNRVTEKPYRELQDSNGRPDKEVAAEAWSQHQARNQSIIIDLFYGQLKSKVRCLCCGNESVRFDPFSLLSLPLPVENFIYFEILVILLNGSVPTKYGLRLNSESSYLHLKHVLSSLCFLKPKHMIVCEVSNSQIIEILHDDQKIKASSAKHLYVYQLPEGSDDHSQPNSTMGVNILNSLEDIQRKTATNLEQKTASGICSETNVIQYTDDEILAQSLPLRNDMQNDHNVVDETYNEVRTKQTAEMSTSSNKASDGFKGRDQSSKSFHADHNRSLDQVQYTNDCGANISGKTYSCDLPQEKPVTDSITKDIRDVEDAKYYYHDAESDASINRGKLNDNSSLLCSRMSSQGCKFGNYFIAVHRQITRQDTYFLSYHKTRPSLFGVPLLIPNCAEGTQKDLYCAVWLQVSRLLSPLPIAKDQSNHAADCDDSLGYNYPFTLRAVKSDGLNCARCTWSNFCRGCEIQCNNNFLFETFDLSGNRNASTQEQSHGNYMDITIAIDWDPTALHLRYQSTLERLWIAHETLEICRKKQTEPIDLDYCLQAFTSEEELEQWYHCSHCGGNKPATKKLQIWKLPPILIIHLKRFNCVNGKWVKSQKVVHFPFNSFDPTPYLASLPQETILRYKELIGTKDVFQPGNKCQAQVKVVDESKIIMEQLITESEPVINTSSLHNAGSINRSKSFNNLSGTESNCNNIVTLNATNDGNCKRNERNMHHETKCIEEVLGNNSPVPPSLHRDFHDFHQHKLKNPNDYCDLKYKLYAVVSHSGMLNGGHYFSYASNSSGSWHCYNDSSCREIPTQPYIDPSSAYLLFYERKGLDYEPYFPNIDGKTVSPAGVSIATDDSENDLKKLCVLS